MEVTALCLRLMMNVLLLLFAHLHFSFSQEAGFPQVVPNKQQHFEYDSIVVRCEGLEGLTGWRVKRKVRGNSTICSSTWETSTGSCEIKTAYAADSGEYWCEMGEKRSNSVNITVSARPVILESPALPVMEGDHVTLRCREKSTFSNSTTGFYKDGLFMSSSSTGELIISSVSRSDEGLYKCSILGSGESTESRLAVRVSPVILESPALPVKEGDHVTLRCRKTSTSNFTADFYKDGLFLGSSSTGDLIFPSVSRSDEGLYKCSISGSGESRESRLTVRVDEELQSSPQLYSLLGSGVGVFLVVLLLLVGQWQCRKRQTSIRGSLQTQAPLTSPSSSQSSSSPHTVSAEAGVAEEPQETYAVVKKIQDEDRQG